MKKKIGVLIIAFLTITAVTDGQTVTSVPDDVTNDRFASEYFSVIRPGLSLNGFDNTGDEDKGLGLKQVLNAALSGGTYIKDKLNSIFNASNNPFQTNNPTQNQIYENSRIVQYTAFEALASYVLEHNGIHQPAGLNIRTHAAAVADLRSKLLFVSSFTMGATWLLTVATM